MTAATITTLTSACFTARISDLGAELQSLTGADGRDWLWHGDAAHWAGRAPVLFPIVGRAVNDCVAVDGVAGAMGQHGFARRMRFALVEGGADFCTHELCADAATRTAYPRDFCLRLTHRLTGAMMQVRAEVTNTDPRPLPFGLGFHPAFRWPLPGAAGRPHHIALDNGAEPALARLEGGFLSARRQPSPFLAGHLPLDPALFAEDAMIFPQGAGSGLRFQAEGGPALCLRFHNLPNLALWTKPAAPFLCIEPWHGMAPMADSGPEIARRPFSLLLEPGGVARFGFDLWVEDQAKAARSAAKP